MIILQALLVLVCLQTPQDIEVQKTIMNRFSYTNGMINILTRRETRKELEIVDAQLRQIEGIKKSVRNQLLELSRTPSNERLSGTKQFEKLNAFLDSQIELIQTEILLPHQFKALTQVYYREKFFSQAGMSFKELADEIPELEINEKQLRKLESVAEQNNRKLAEATEAYNLRIAKIRSESKQKMLSVLKPEQRKILEDKIGKVVELDAPQARQKR